MRLINQLKKALKESLSSEVAHQEMNPITREERVLKFKKHTNPRLSAVVILLFPDENNVMKSVLIERTAYKGAHSKQISLPGGKQDETDEDLEHTGLRELYEEIGVPSDDIEILGELSTVDVPVSGFVIHPFVAWLKQTPDFVLDKREVAKLIQYPVSVLQETNVIQNRIVEVDHPKMKLNVPSFEIENHIVWGATAMILNEFRKIVELI